MQKVLLAIPLLLVVGCGSLTPDANLYLACKSFSQAEKDLRPFKADMSPDQVGAVKKALEIVVPLCQSRAADVADPVKAVSTIREHLGKLLAIQRSKTNA